MKHVVICANKSKPHMLAAVHGIEPWLRERAEVRVDLNPDAQWDGDHVDFVAVYGGDGTVLGAARKYGSHGIPIVGVNLGKFGFLTESTADHDRELLQDVLEGRYELRERMMLRCRLEREDEILLDCVGLNDAVVSRGALSRLIRLEFLVDGEPVTNYSADGLIVSTPVGSTAHSLAASGPIVHPELDGFVVTPICPHTLSNRPLVLPPDVMIEMRPTSFSDNPALTVDGSVYKVLHEADRVLVQKAESKLRMIRTGRQSFFQTLRNKLDWSGHPRYGK